MTSPSPKAPQPQKKKGKSRVSRKPPSFQQRAWAILKEIRKLRADLAQETGRAFTGDNTPRNVEVTVQIPLEERLHKDRYEEVTGHLLESLSPPQSSSVNPHDIDANLGSIHCFQCDSIHCSHSIPHKTDLVFGGYTPTGKPTWETLTNLLLRVGDPRIHQLYDKKPHVLAFMWSDKDLNEGLLPEFGKDNCTYHLRGQVALGYLHKLPSQDAPRAIAFQIIEFREDQGHSTLAFNVTGTSLRELAEAGEKGRSAYASLYLKARETRERIQGLARRWKDAQRRGGDFSLQRGCDQLMRSLRGDLERLFRAQGRRTLHGQERHEGGERPTSHAYRDLLLSSGESTYRDTMRGTVVIVGSKGRVHVFSGEGKLVTSLSLGKQDVEKRLVEGRWSPMGSQPYEGWKKTAIKWCEGRGPASKPGS